MKSREKRKKSISSMLMVYRKSLKKVESLDRSGILLRHNNDLDVIKGVHSNPLARKKGSFPQSVAERTNDAALYTNMKTTLTRQISLFVTPDHVTL